MFSLLPPSVLISTHNSLLLWIYVKYNTVHLIMDEKPYKEVPNQKLHLSSQNI